jgi:hypothetical protein
VRLTDRFSLNGDVQNGLNLQHYALFERSGDGSQKAAAEQSGQTGSRGRIRASSHRNGGPFSVLW